MHIPLFRSLIAPALAAVSLMVSALAADIHDSLVPVEPNLSPGPEYADSTRMFQGIPGFERAANGRLWALWYAGGTTEGPDNYVVLVTSGDDGKTWSGPRVVIDPPGDVRAYDPTLWHDPQGRLWMFWAQSSNWWDGRSGVWAMVAENSGDETPRWSEPRRICNGIMMNKPTALKNGDWLLPVSMWGMPADKRTRAEHRHELTAESGAQAVITRDQGKTFEVLGKTHAPGNTFDEHLIVERRDGSLWMLIRTKQGIAESVSTDGGKTWPEATLSKIPHVNSRFFIRRLASGKLLLVRHNPPDLKTRSHLTAFLSDDDGMTWTGGLMLDERKNVSYPDGVEDKEGVIRIIYDYERTKEKQIFMAAFTEADVAAGKPSASTRLQIVVNQATGVAPAKAEKAEKPTAKAAEAWPALPTGALPPLVVSNDPAYDQYVSRLYVMSTVLPNGRICYVAYGSKGVPPGTDGAAPPNYLTFYYSDDKGATLHIGFFLVPPPDPEAPGGMVDPRIGQTPDGDAMVYFPTVHGGRPQRGWYSLYGCVVRNSQTGKRGTFSVGPSTYICRGTAGVPTIVGSEILVPTFVSQPAGRGITHDYDGVRLWKIGIGAGDVLKPELLSQLPDLPNLDDNSGFCDPFIVSLGGGNYRMLIRAMSGPYWCDSTDHGRAGTWGVPYQPAGIPMVKNVIDGMATDQDGEVVVAYNPSLRGRTQAALAVYRKNGEIAKLVFDPRVPPVAMTMANFVVSIDRNSDGKPTGNYIVTYDHGRNTKPGGLEPDGINYRGAICTAIVPKSSVLAGTLDGVVIHEVPTHPQAAGAAAADAPGATIAPAKAPAPATEKAAVKKQPAPRSLSPDDFGITTLTPPVLNTSPGPRYWPRLRMWQGIPGITRSPQGRLWATWYTGPLGEGIDGNHAVLVTSEDDGQTWSKPVAVFDPTPFFAGNTGDAHLWTDPQGRVWWFVNRVLRTNDPNGIRSMWAFCMENPEDAAPRFSAPVFAGYGIGLNKPTVLKDGTWLCPVDNFDGKDPLRTQVWASKDQGRSFALLASVAIKDVVFSEHQIVERKDGSLLLCARTTYGIARTESLDGGATWKNDRPLTTERSVNTRFFLTKLKSGALLLVVNDDPRRRANMTAMLSEDEGETWPYKLALDERQRVSYPDGAEAADGSIYVTYDHGRYEKDEQEILFAKITEADIRAGKVVSEGSRLQQVINRLADSGGGVHVTRESVLMQEEYEKSKGLPPRRKDLKP